MTYLRSCALLAAMLPLLATSFGGEAMARGGVYFSGAVFGAPAYYPYPPYYPAYPYYAYPAPGYAYAPQPMPPPGYVYAAPPPVVYAPPVVGGIGVRIR